jgi:2-dehydro-3-deoxyphosphogluconate aldolase / (4S)-4-hydroxy-2-oxoglutarate aldolase
VSLVEQIRQTRLIPVIVIEDAKHAESLARALSDGGLPCAEVTYRTKAAGEALRRMTAAFPDMLIGAGTVLTPEQARSARDAGAKFMVAPGFNPAVVDYCQEHDIPVFPGVATPTEVEMALNKGLRVVKFFPAEPMGGIAYLKAIAAPYVDVEFIPTGGISDKNVHEYLSFKKVVACGGSWMAPADWISAGDFEKIKDATARAVSAVRSGKDAAQ